MSVPEWRRLALNDGLVLEPTPDNSRLALWVPGSRDGGFQHWQRISNVARSEITVREGLSATAAMSIQARQPIRGLLGKLLGGSKRVPERRARGPPRGELGEPCRRKA